MGIVRNPFSLAVSAFSFHRVDVSRRLRARGHLHVAGRRTRRTGYRAADCFLYALTFAGELAARRRAKLAVLGDVGGEFAGGHDDEADVVFDEGGAEVVAVLQHVVEDVSRFVEGEVGGFFGGDDEEAVVVEGFFVEWGEV